MTDDFAADHRSQAATAINNYFDALNSFYVMKEGGGGGTIREACDLATKNVTDTRLRQVELSLSELSKKLNSSPSLGIFILDLALSFIPVVGGYVAEAAIKYARNVGKQQARMFQNVVAGQRKFELVRAEVMVEVLTKESRDIRKRLLDPKISDKVYDRYQSVYEDLIGTRGALKSKIAETESGFVKALGSARTGGISDELFQYSTPAINDWFQAMGQKIMERSPIEDVAVFRQASNPIDFSTYNELAIQSFGSSPNALVTYIVGEICGKQLRCNQMARALALQINNVMNTLEYFEDTKALYTHLLALLPGDSTYFKLTLAEQFEAILWLMFLPNPKDWAHAKDPSGNYVRTQAGLYSQQQHFYLKRNLPSEIEKHLLDRFRVNLGGEDIRNFRKYYTDEKKKNVQQGPYNLGIDRSAVYLYNRPDKPRKPVEDVSSIDYTADETALANLQIHFSQMYELMKIGEPYFKKIINNHLLL